MTAPKPPLQNNADLPEFDVAVVVFTRVRGVDRLDASHIAESAVARAIVDAPAPSGADLVLRRTTRTQNLQVPVVVAGVRELGIACGNGYLWVEVTKRAYRESSRTATPEEDL